MKTLNELVDAYVARFGEHGSSAAEYYARPAFMAGAAAMAELFAAGQGLRVVHDISEPRRMTAQPIGPGGHEFP